MVAQADRPRVRDPERVQQVRQPVLVDRRPGTGALDRLEVGLGDQAPVAVVADLVVVGQERVQPLD
jgi:hypothetical protein